MPSVLVIFTSAPKTFTGHEAGWYLPEAAHPYYVFKDKVDMDFASPKGPNPPVDEQSVKLFAEDPESVKFLSDPEAQAKLASAKKLSEVDISKYDAIFYVGGHGPVIDLPTDPDNIKLASSFYQTGKITASVCHGPAALVGATDASGKSIFAGKKFTGFSNAEEKIIGTVETLPFLLEDKIASLGGIYSKADEAWASNVVVDGNLYTGQNPASGGPLAKEVLKGLAITA